MTTKTNGQHMKLPAYRAMQSVKMRELWGNSGVIKDKVIRARVTQIQFDKINAMAVAKGMTVTDLILEGLGVAK